MTVLKDIFHAIQLSKMDSGIAKVLLMLLSRLHKGFDPTELLVVVSKVHIIWEGHKILQKFALLLTVCTVVKSKVKISQIFEAFSECMNFKKVAFCSLIFFFGMYRLHLQLIFTLFLLQVVTRSVLNFSYCNISKEWPKMRRHIWMLPVLE